MKSYWTNAIFKSAGYNSSNEVFTRLITADENLFVENSLVSKEQFIQNLKSLLQSIEQTGDSLSEAKDMLAAGSIFEGAFPGQYGSLRTSYIKERKKFKKQLLVIKLLFPQR